MKRTFAVLLFMSALVGRVGAGPRELPLRWERGTCIYEATTSQTVETAYGTNLLSLPFPATTNYDFYFPPLALPTALTTQDKGGGTVFMKNLSSSTANNFTVTGRMRFYDYDPATGTQALIVDTGTSPSKNVNYGQSINWSLANVWVPNAYTVPAGHLLHITLTLTLVSGNPAGFAQLMYNGASATSTVAFLSEDKAADWTFSAPVLPAQSMSLSMMADGCANISCAGYPNQAYLVQATTSLSSPSWATIATNTAGSGGLFSYVDADAPNFPVRFYRTSTP